MGRLKTQVLAVPNTAVHQGDLILVNPAHPLWGEVAPGALAEAGGGVCLERRAAALLAQALGKIGAGRAILPVSGYRTLAEQQAIYTGATHSYGPDYARTYVALPGCSEHQTGLAVDLALNNGQVVDPITPAFPYSGICQAFRQAAVRYGFVQRYPKGKSAVTHIGHEPWHFRFVGMPHAFLMHTLGLVLEEYIDWLRGHVLGQNPYLLRTGGREYEIGYLPAADGGTTEMELSAMPYTLSGNNVDGFVAAVWRKAE